MWRSYLHGTSDQRSLLPVCQKEYELDESSTSKKHNEVKGNGDADLLQPSTSHGTLHVIIDAAGPGPSAGQKVGVSRKRQSCDSDSSSDGDSFVISSTNELHPSESKHQSMMSKRLHSKSGFEDDCRSRKAKRRCIEAGSSLKISKSVLKPVPADSSGDAATASSTNEQKDKLLLSQRPIPASDENEIDDSRPSDTSQETWTFKTDEHGTTYRFLRNWRQNCNGPLLFRLPHHEPSSDSTISDMCIMAFLLSDEADGVGYVRIMAPQFTSTQPKLHTLVIKNYKMITDATLLYLMKVRSLRELDVSGTSVTEGGILQFKLKRPEVNVTCDFKNLPV
ncbi:hypothetical protein C0J52_14437 [Blattella germanica]|nr:hypothetical protein C0J52_14437 [Blattella germanica]